MPYRDYKVCPYCNDKGMIIKEDLETKEKVKVKGITCMCQIALTVNKLFPILSTVPDPSIEDIVSIGKTYKIKTIDKTFKYKNCVFFGDEKKFIYLFKSICLGSYYGTTKFELLDGLQVVHKYHVEQMEGIDRDIYTLLNFDLLGLFFTNETENKAMDKTVHDTVEGRLRYGKNTWAFAKSSIDLKRNKGCNENTYTMLMDSNLFEIIDLSTQQNFDYSGYNSEFDITRKSSSEANRIASKLFS